MQGKAPNEAFRTPGQGQRLARLLAMAVLAILSILAASSMPAVTADETVPAQWANEWPATDFTSSGVPFSQILSGGVPKDGIPSIDAPKFAALVETTDLSDTEPVIGLEIAGDARAYPLRVLTWHEIVNDTVGGRPVTITYCPLCNAAIVFDRRVEGTATTFGTTGKLRNSDLIMYDRDSESWWQQFSGEAIIGRHLGAKLDIVPARLESFAAFRERFPGGRVLVPNDPTFRPYGRNPYPQYDSAAVPFLFGGPFPEGIEPMARVVVVTGKDASGNDQRQAVALSLLREKGTMSLGGIDLRWSSGQASALDTHAIAKGRDVGNVVATSKDDAGVPRDVHYDVTFAFVFHAFHPENEILTE